MSILFFILVLCFILYHYFKVISGGTIDLPTFSANIYTKEHGITHNKKETGCRAQDSLQIVKSETESSDFIKQFFENKSTIYNKMVAHNKDISKRFIDIDQYNNTIPTKIVNQSKKEVTTTGAEIAVIQLLTELIDDMELNYNYCNNKFFANDIEIWNRNNTYKYANIHVKYIGNSDNASSGAHVGALHSRFLKKCYELAYRHHNLSSDDYKYLLDPDNTILLNDETEELKGSSEEQIERMKNLYYLDNNNSVKVNVYNDLISGRTRPLYRKKIPFANEIYETFKLIVKYNKNENYYIHRPYFPDNKIPKDSNVATKLDYNKKGGGKRPADQTNETNETNENYRTPVGKRRYHNASTDLGYSPKLLENNKYMLDVNRQLNPLDILAIVSFKGIVKNKLYVKFFNLNNEAILDVLIIDLYGEKVKFNNPLTVNLNEPLDLKVKK